MLNGRIVTVAGGSGFLGHYVVKHLANAGYTVRVLCRKPHLAQDLKVCGVPGQVVIDYADLTKPETLKGKLDGSDAVINLCGILFECGSQKFARIHATGAERLAQEAKAAGAAHFIQMSALGVDRAKGSTYARTKLEGEKAVRAVYPGATVFRPSVMFGAEDNFINYFAWLGKFTPVLPAIGGGKPKFQPVWVDDVARAVVKVLEQPALAGKTYELGGPDVVSFREILDYIDTVLHRHRSRMPLPFAAASAMGALMQLLPGRPPVTSDQVQMLKTDNVCSGELPGFDALGIAPSAMEAEVPRYLGFRAQADAA